MFLCCVEESNMFVSIFQSFIVFIEFFFNCNGFVHTRNQPISPVLIKRPVQLQEIPLIGILICTYYHSEAAWCYGDDLLSSR